MFCTELTEERIKEPVLGSVCFLTSVRMRSCVRVYMHACVVGEASSPSVLESSSLPTSGVHHLWSAVPFTLDSGGREPGGRHWEQPAGLGALLEGGLGLFPASLWHLLEILSNGGCILLPFPILFHGLAPVHSSPVLERLQSKLEEEELIPYQPCVVSKHCSLPPRQQESSSSQPGHQDHSSLGLLAVPQLRSPLCP